MLFLYERNVMKVEKKRKQELQIIEQMIHLYCRGKHGQKKELCEECEELFQYAKARIEKCPFMKEKTFCSNCRVHCYKSDMRVKIKEVMRYSGPRMMLVKPHLVLLHAYHSIKYKRKQKREEHKK